MGLIFVEILIYFVCGKPTYRSYSHKISLNEADI